MWFWESVNVPPDGGGVCGGSEISVGAYSASRSRSFARASAVFGTSLYSGSRSSATIDITGYGIRSGRSVSRTASFMNIGNGLTVFNGQDLVSTNTNVLRFDGDVIGATDTINKLNDASVYAPAVVEVDGGDASEQFEVLDGGDADENT